MKMSNISALMADIAPVIREYTAAALAPVSEQIKTLSDRLDGLQVSGDNQEALALVRLELGNEIGQIRAAFADVQNKVGGIDDRVRSAVAAIPPAVGVAGALIDRDEELVLTLTDGNNIKLGRVVGKSVDERVIMQRLCGEASDRIEALKADVVRAEERLSAFEMPDVLGLIADAVKTLPARKTPAEMWAEIQPMADVEIEKAVSKIPKPRDGKDGRGVASLIVDRSGELVSTMTDGHVERHGVVVGRDGRDADRASIVQEITDYVKALPKPKDGRDGLGFDDMTEELADDGRTIVRRFMRGDQVREFRHSVAAVLDRGQFKSGKTYQAGDLVTWGGSTWIAQRDTTSKPETDDSWRLAVKRGRDGRGAKP